MLPGKCWLPAYCFFIAYDTAPMNGKGFQFQRQFLNTGWFALFYLVIFGSLAGYSAYIWLFQVQPCCASKHLCLYVNPVVAVLLGMFVLGEKNYPTA